MKNESLESRLINYKFGSATQFIDSESADVQDLVNALSDAFSNIGWFEGGMSIVIRHALENIGINFN